MVSRANGKETMMDKQVMCFGQGIHPEVVRIVQSSIEPFGVGISVGQHGYNKVTLWPDDPVQFLQGFGIDGNVFQYSASNDAIEGIILVGQLIGMSQLGVLQAGEVVEGLILRRVDIAPIKLHFGTAQQPDQASVRGVTTSPVQYRASSFKDILTTLEDADLAADHG